jgi:hypothetical protein
MSEENDGTGTVMHGAGAGTDARSEGDDPDDGRKGP